MIRKVERVIAILFVVAGLAWTTWAAAAFYDFRSGLQNADPVSLERRIDWSSVRERLREDLQARSGPQSRRQLGPSMPWSAGRASSICCAR